MQDLSEAEEKSASTADESNVNSLARVRRKRHTGSQAKHLNNLSEAQKLEIIDGKVDLLPDFLGFSFKLKGRKKKR